MAYSTSNPPNRIAQGVGSAPTLWQYSSTDAHTAVDATDYFTNAKDLGMRADDIMIVVDTNTPTCPNHHGAATDADGNGPVRVGDRSEALVSTAL